MSQQDEDLDLSDWEDVSGAFSSLKVFDSEKLPIFTDAHKNMQNQNFESCHSYSASQIINN